jgi:hypothetical protein
LPARKPFIFIDLHSGASCKIVILKDLRPKYCKQMACNGFAIRDKKNATKTEFTPLFKE